MRIVETATFQCDPPRESFVNLPPMIQKDADAVAGAINSAFGDFSDRHWKVVKNDYVPVT